MFYLVDDKGEFVDYFGKALTAQVPDPLGRDSRRILLAPGEGQTGPGPGRKAGRGDWVRTEASTLGAHCTGAGARGHSFTRHVASIEHTLTLARTRAHASSIHTLLYVFTCVACLRFNRASCVPGCSCIHTACVGAAEEGGGFALPPSQTQLLIIFSHSLPSLFLLPRFHSPAL